MESQNINTNMNNNNIDDNSTLGNTVAVPASLLPPYRQGEDQSFAHVESPSAVARVEVLLSSWKQKLDGIANQAIETMKAMIPDDKKESMNKTWDSMNEAAETAVKNIKEYYSSTRVGKATIDAEQWMEKEANEAQKRVQATVASYYQQYMNNDNNSNNTTLTPLKIDLDAAPVPSTAFSTTVGPVTTQMKATLEGRNTSAAEDIDVEPLPSK